MSEHVRRTWHGDELIARTKRANGRAIVGMGEQAAVEMETLAHVGETGILKKSIHVARADTGGAVDADQMSSRTGLAKWQIEVGSWVDYACVENSRGGDHRFADIGFQLAEHNFRGTLDRAWREEGL